MNAQLLGALVLLSIAALLVLYVRKKGVDPLVFALVAVLVVLAAIAAFPRQAFQFLPWFFRPFDAFLTILAVTTFLLAVKTYLKQRDHERALTRIVRESALRDVQEPSEKAGK